MSKKDDASTVAALPAAKEFEDRAALEALMPELIAFKKKYPTVNVADLLESVGSQVGLLSRV